MCFGTFLLSSNSGSLPREAHMAKSNVLNSSWTRKRLLGPKGRIPKICHFPTDRNKGPPGRYDLGGSFKHFLIFTPNLGEDEPILTNIFQMGWNHQPVMNKPTLIFWWGPEPAEFLIPPKIAKKNHAIGTVQHPRTWQFKKYPWRKYKTRAALKSNAFCESQILGGPSRVLNICFLGFSKVVSTHLWNTPLNLYQRAMSRDSFHSGRTGDCRTGVLYGCVVIFVDLKKIQNQGLLC